MVGGALGTWRQARQGRRPTAEGDGRAEADAARTLTEEPVRAPVGGSPVL